MLTKRSFDTSDQSSFLIWAHSSAERRAVLMGLASQPTGGQFAIARACLPDLRGELGAALLHRAAAIRSNQLLARFDQSGQRGFGVAGDGEVRFA